MTRFFALLFLLVLASTAQSQTRHENPSTSTGHSCAVPDMRTHIRPAPDGMPTVIRTGVRVIDIREINDVDQTITIDLAIRRSWQDDRLAGLEGCKLELGSVWFPELVLLNSGRLFERWPETVTIGPGGAVTYLQRISGTLASYHALRDFPFDFQSIDLSFILLDYDPGNALIELDTDFVGIYDRLNISDWRIKGVAAQIDDGFIADAFDEARTKLVLTIDAERIRAFYVWKIILPISLIVFMSWSVFWIDPAQYGPQIGLSATSMLTIIAFIFAATNMLPPLGYFTLMDFFIGGATIFVFLALLVSLTTTYLNTIEFREGAKILDKACRFVFPLAYVAFNWFVFRSVL
ncbi:MAG: hypothetical protein AAFN16_16025 [Pseudomonadota bacterium]